MRGVMLGDKPSGMSWEEWGRIEDSANIYNNAEELLKDKTPITPNPVRYLNDPL